jgi:hypothetical protein
MARVALGDHGVARGDRGDEVTACDGVEGEREVVRPEHQHGGAERGVLGANVGLGVDGRATPGALANSSRTLTQLPERSRQLDRAQPRLGGQRRFARGRLYQLVAPGFDGLRVALEEIRKGVARRRAKLCGGPGGGLECSRDIGRARNWIALGVSRFGLGIDRAELSGRSLRMSPLSVDQNGL